MYSSNDRDIDRMFSSLDYKNDYLTTGYLLCYIVHLQKTVTKSGLSTIHINCLLEDVQELLQFVLSDHEKSDQGLLILNRIWRTYPELSFHSEY